MRRLRRRRNTSTRLELSRSDRTRLKAKDFRGRASYDVGYFAQRDVSCKFSLRRRHLDLWDTTRYNEVEVRQFGAHVEGEPMPGDPIARVHANGRNLLLSRPNAGVLRNTLGRDSELAERPNEQFLDLAEIPVKILLVAFEIDDRIADELARPVKGDVSATLDIEQLHATLRELLRRCQHVSILRRASQRDHSGMLH